MQFLANVCQEYFIFLYFLYRILSRQHKRARPKRAWPHAQRKAAREYLGGKPDIQLVAEHTEVESGKKSDRPELQTALATCKRHKATLIIAKFDRLARNVAFIGSSRTWSRAGRVRRCRLTRIPQKIHARPAGSTHNEITISLRIERCCAFPRRFSLTDGRSHNNLGSILYFLTSLERQRWVRGNRRKPFARPNCTDC
jgi:hypothetical protein